MTITEFKIKKLWGIYSYNINIENNKLILVAENGEGKTIILRLFYYFLSKQWDKLSGYDFKSISAIIDNEEYKVNHRDFSKNVTPTQLKIVSEKYPIYKEFINNGLKILFRENSINDLKNPFKIRNFSNKHSISESVLENLIQDVIELRFKDFDYDYEIPIIFLPTYRRIEQDFSKIFKDLKYKKENRDEDFSVIWENISPDRWEQNNIALELVEFGLKDIEFKLNKAIREENNTEIVKIFINKCNSFFVNKKLILDNLEIKVKLVNSDNKYDLNKENIFSSGEKQIISIFFYLYLNEQKYFVIFDEPELSISLRWQEKIINEIQDKISGLIIATHSGTILKHHKQYARSLKQLKTQE